MRRVLLTALLLFACAVTLHAQTFPLDGTWQGTFRAGSQQVRVILEIRHTPQGQLTATIYSPDQGPEPLRVEALTAQQNRLSFAVPDVGATWSGVLTSTGNSLQGSITQGQTSPLDFTRASGAALWIDPRIHGTPAFISVAPGVHLQVIDWGGAGRTLVLLTGLGNTAHIYDQFAQQLTPHFHVIGITRRGFGESSTPPTTDIANYSADRLGEDVFVVIHSLHLDKPVLIGHSIAGEELSAIANRHPDAVSALIYLDAGFPYAFYDPSVGDYTLDLLTLQRQLSSLLPGAAPSQNPAALLSTIASEMPTFQHDLETQQSMLSFMPPPPLSSGTRTLSPADAIIRGEQKFTHIPLPVLAIFAVPHNVHAMVPDGSPETLKKAEALDRNHMTQVSDTFAKGIPTATVIRIPNADHYIYLSNQADVLREINSFLTRHP